MTQLTCISLWQPFASLIFVADEDLRKVHETRKFQFPERLLGQRIGVHAARHRMSDRYISPELDDLCVQAFGALYRMRLPVGAVIGTVIINEWRITHFTDHASNADYTAGDWSPGRYAWRTEEPRALATPFPAIGRQRWFSVDIKGEDADAR